MANTKAAASKRMNPFISQSLSQQFQSQSRRFFGIIVIAAWRSRAKGATTF
jgi:hypothetical protein